MSPGVSDDCPDGSDGDEGVTVVPRTTISGVAAAVAAGSVSENSDVGVSVVRTTASSVLVPRYFAGASVVAVDGAAIAVAIVVPDAVLAVIYCCCWSPPPRRPVAVSSIEFRSRIVPPRHHPRSRYASSCVSESH